MTVKTNLTDIEIASAFSGPASGVNRFIATPNGTWVRLAFLERGSDDIDHFRSAVILAPGDVAALVELLSQYLPQK